VSDLPWRHADAGVIVHFRLTPKSSKDAIGGLEAAAGGPAFKARVRALPEDGAANAALEQLAAKWLGVARSNVRLVSGAKSRVKSLVVAGDRNEIDKKLRAAYAAAQGAEK